MCLPVKPFKIEREWTHKGLKCAVVLAREAGHRCGYVRVPKDHPAYKKDYNDVEVDVHGGLTFADLEPCEHEDGQGWWLGFDCAHCYDESHDPAASENDPNLAEDTRSILKIHRECGGRFSHDGHPLHYWTQPEVERETERLAEQLAVVEPSNSGNRIPL